MRDKSHPWAMLGQVGHHWLGWLVRQHCLAPINTYSLSEKGWVWSKRNWINLILLHNFTIISLILNVMGSKVILNFSSSFLTRSRSYKYFVLLYFLCCWAASLSCTVVKNVSISCIYFICRKFTGMVAEIKRDLILCSKGLHWDDYNKLSF